MSAERRESVPEYDTDAADLADEVARIVGSGTVRASYGSGERLRESHGVARLVSIAVTNPDLAHRTSDDVDGVLARIAHAAAAWLRGRTLLVPGTLISIHLVREVDLVLVSWARGFGGRNFWIGDDGGPTLAAPPSSTDETS
jgi:hypothetical protein